MSVIIDDNERYIPIIKWQKNERLALRFVDEDVKPYVLPCFEIRNSDQHTKLLECYEEVWCAEAIVDYSNPQGMLTVDRMKELCEFLQYARDNKHPIFPALNPMDLSVFSNQNLMKIVSKQQAVAFRLRVLNYQVTEQQLDRCQKVAKTLAQNLQYLIVDFGQSPQKDDVVDLAALSLSLIKLRSIVTQSIHLISGAFPNDLSSVKNGPKSFPRYDLLFWRKLKSQNPKVSMGYGDYGILSPGWTEETLQRRGSRVAIRYSCADDWLVLRGSNATTAESIALSELMLTVHEDVFKGEEYSWGDKIIADRANPDVLHKNKRSGGYHFAEAWSHHIAFVVKDD